MTEITGEIAFVDSESILVQWKFTGIWLSFGIRRTISLASRAIRKIRSDGLIESLKYTREWISENYHEWRLGIESAEYVQARDLGIDGVDYAPADYRSLTTALRGLDISPARDVFLDYGSGKGRVVVMAATYPFRRVIGVELSEQLNAIARKNIQRAARKLRCNEIEIITADASTYRVPDDVTVVFLNIGGRILAAVLERLNESMAKSPRKITILFKYPRWVDNLLGQCDWLTVRREIPCYSEFGERFLVYETTATRFKSLPRIVGSKPIPSSSSLRE
ncbi:MAG: class I SAM-dependent methyltransferase [Deltaproteobacteria bacterium]|nr:class I SAM-dependent methyltransferase [Deltaproteobacteria bacterium]